VFPGTPAALGDAGRDDRSSAEFGFAGFASLCMAREVSDSGDSMVRTVWPAEAGRPSVCRVAGVGPSTAGVGPVTAVSEHAASRTHASTTTGTSVPILTPPALTTPATVPGTVGTVVSNRVIAKDPPQPALRHLSTTVFSSANRNHCLGPWLDSSERAPRPSASRISSHHRLRAHRQRGARDHHCPSETRVSPRYPRSRWQCPHRNLRNGPHLNSVATALAVSGSSCIVGRHDPTPTPNRGW